MSIFQLVFLGVFAVFIMAGLIAVAIYSRTGTVRSQGTAITIWGSFNPEVMSAVISQVRKDDPTLITNYVYVEPASFDFKLLEAITAGQSPDAILVSNESLMSNLRMIYPVSYAEYPARSFKDTFVQEGELYFTSQYISAIPFSIDPYVMFWNRDLFANAGLNTPPKYWDELFYLTGKLTKVNSSGDIVQSAVALGGYDNVDHAKNILSALLLQSGNTITSWDMAKNLLKASLFDSTKTSAASILSFYTQFADPSKPVYSWNASLPDSKSMFISGRLAIYFGPASELRELKTKNPNLNFDVATLPQFKDAPISSTFGDMYALAMLRTSANLASRLRIINDFTSARAIGALSNSGELPPVRKDVAISSSDPYMTIFKNAAIVSQGWLEPNKLSSDAMFKEMIDSVASGKSDSGAALGLASKELEYAANQVYAQ